MITVDDRCWDNHCWGNCCRDDCCRLKRQLLLRQLPHLGGDQLTIAIETIAVWGNHCWGNCLIWGVNQQSLLRQMLLRCNHCRGNCCWGNHCSDNCCWGNCYSVDCCSDDHCWGDCCSDDRCWRDWQWTLAFTWKGDCLKCWSQWGGGQGGSTIAVEGIDSQLSLPHETEWLFMFTPHSMISTLKVMFATCGILCVGKVLVDSDLHISFLLLFQCIHYFYQLLKWRIH